MDISSFMASLVPAFTAGLALQRLIEITDPLVNRLVSQENKALWLGLLSLVVGLSLAYGLDLHVLLSGYATASTTLKFVDHLVTGLIVSAGTDGFNSLLKFANYKKEEQKSETLKQKVSLSRELLLRADTLNGGNTMAVEDVFKNALQDRVREFKNNFSLVLDFKNGKLNQHVATDAQAQAVVIDATDAAANHFNLRLNSAGRQIIRGSISVNSKYGDAVNVMDEAVSKGTDPKEIIG